MIGYGNTLREDDGVGYRVAEAITAVSSDHLRTISCHQLTPELAAELATCDRVIFVDARLPDGIMEVSLRRLWANNAGVTNTHHCTPYDLLQLVNVLYGVCPKAYQILLPTQSMDFGETLSPVATAGMETALAHLPILIEQPHLPDDTVWAVVIEQPDASIAGGSAPSF